MKKVKLYIYNKGTNTLHIHGLCKDAHGSSNSDYFETENDAVKSKGRSLRMCQPCLDKRDEILNKLNLEELKWKEKF